MVYIFEHTMRYVLFVKKQDEACLRALKVSSQSNNIYELDITLLPTRPTWLRGVPSLLDRTKNILYEGTKCLMFLKTTCGNDFDIRFDNTSFTNIDDLYAESVPQQKQIKVDSAQKTKEEKKIVDEIEEPVPIVT